MSDGVNHIDCSCLACEAQKMERLETENRSLKLAIAVARGKIAELILYLEQRL